MCRRLTSLAVFPTLQHPTDQRQPGSKRRKEWRTTLRGLEDRLSFPGIRGLSSSGARYEGLTDDTHLSLRLFLILMATIGGGRSPVPGPGACAPLSAASSTGGFDLAFLGSATETEDATGHEWQNPPVQKPTIMCWSPSHDSVFPHGATSTFITRVPRASFPGP